MESFINRYGEEMSLRYDTDKKELYIKHEDINDNKESELFFFIKRYILHKEEKEAITRMIINIKQWKQ